VSVNVCVDRGDARECLKPLMHWGALGGFGRQVGAGTYVNGTRPSQPRAMPNSVLSLLRVVRRVPVTVCRVRCLAGCT
jgi:hypothetical protein